MKSVIKGICCVALLFALSACGGKEESSAKASSQDKAPKKEVASSSKSSSDKPAASNRKGRLIYKQYCVICHGSDGKLGVSDAKDLSVSTISMEERIDQITNGKGLMTPYKDILSEEQIQSVAAYLDELKQ